MSITRLHPVTLPKLEASNHDRIMAALNQALEDQKRDEKLNQSAKGVAIVWFTDESDGRFGASWIIQGLNVLEAIGLMHLTANDLAHDGLDGACNHFSPEDPA